MSLSINGTNGLTFSDGTSQNTGATGFGFKNRIINGAMMIDQRNAGASVTANDGIYTLDRWYYNAWQNGKGTIQRSTTAPTGFINSLLFTSSSAYSVGAGETFDFQQRIEGLNVADLGWGTASAATVTLSFWVRSSLTGTFGGALQNSAQNRSYVFSYTINAANTWEQKTITIAGDTSGTWLTTNGIGILLSINLASGANYQTTAGSWVGSGKFAPTGSTSVVGTNGATFYITGVQLEKGSTATSFDYRPYTTELQLCQRYFISYGGNSVYERLAMTSSYSTSGSSVVLAFPVTMRSIPSISYSALSDWADELPAVTSEVLTSLSSDANGSSPKIIKFDIGHAVNGSFGGNKSSVIRASNTGNARMTFSAEL